MEFENIKELDICKQNLITLPKDINEYINFTKLICCNNKITTLDNLPQDCKY